MSNHYFVLDPDTVPILKFKAGGADFINVGWELSSEEVEDHVHYYELELTNNTTRLVTIQSADSQNMFVFDKLSSATTYLIRVRIAHASRDNRLNT